MKKNIVFVPFFIFILGLEAMEKPIPEGVQDASNLLICYANLPIRHLGLMQANLNQLIQYYGNYLYKLKTLKASNEEFKKNKILAIRIIIRDILDEMTRKLESNLNLLDKQQIEELIQKLSAERNMRISCREKTTTKTISNEIYKAREKIISTAREYLKKIEIAYSYLANP